MKVQDIVFNLIAYLFVTAITIVVLTYIAIWVIYDIAVEVYKRES